MQDGHSPGKWKSVKSWWEIFLMEKSGKFMEICQSQGKVREYEIVLANDLENNEVAHSVSMSYQYYFLLYR